MATIRDVARKAGVAPITVSRVINNSGYVSAEKRQRVEAAVAELGYIPNRLASGLRHNQTKTLALLVSDITNPFWTTVARGVEDAARAQGFNVILCNTDESVEKQADYLDLVLQKQVDGILLVPVESECAAITRIQQQNAPVVVLDRQVPGAAVDVVRCASEEGAYQLTHLLLTLGHRHIALLNGSEAVSIAGERAQGYARALAEFDVPPENSTIFYGGFTLDGGLQTAQEALQCVPRPTAFVATNNFIAIGALRTLAQAGINVPEDIAVVGFDDLPAELVVEPFLTVVAQPAYQMGQIATELLLERIGDKQAPDQWQHIVLPTELIVRKSSGEPVVAGP